MRVDILVINNFDMRAYLYFVRRILSYVQEIGFHNLTEFINVRILVCVVLAFCL